MLCRKWSQSTASVIERIQLLINSFQNAFMLLDSWQITLICWLYRERKGAFHLKNI